MKRNGLGYQVYISGCVSHTLCIALLWGWGLLLSMVVVTHEQLYGPYPTKNLTLFLVAYGAYALVPLGVMGRVARTPLFTVATPTLAKSAAKKKKQY